MSENIGNLVQKLLDEQAQDKAGVGKTKISGLFNLHLVVGEPGTAKDLTDRLKLEKHSVVPGVEVDDVKFGKALVGWLDGTDSMTPGDYLDDLTANLVVAADVFVVTDNPKAENALRDHLRLMLATKPGSHDRIASQEFVPGGELTHVKPEGSSKMPAEVDQMVVTNYMRRLARQQYTKSPSVIKLGGVEVVSHNGARVEAFVITVNRQNKAADVAIFKVGNKYCLKADLKGSQARHVIDNRAGNLTQDLQAKFDQTGTPGVVRGKSKQAGSEAGIGGPNAAKGKSKHLTLFATDRSQFEKIVDQFFNDLLAGSSILQKTADKDETNMKTEAITPQAAAPSEASPEDIESPAAVASKLTRLATSLRREDPTGKTYIGLPENATVNLGNNRQLPATAMDVKRGSVTARVYLYKDGPMFVARAELLSSGAKTAARGISNAGATRKLKGAMGDDVEGRLKGAVGKNESGVKFIEEKANNFATFQGVASGLLEKLLAGKALLTDQVVAESFGLWTQPSQDKKARPEGIGAATPSSTASLDKDGGTTDGSGVPPFLMTIARRMCRGENRGKVVIDDTAKTVVDNDNTYPAVVLNIVRQTGKASITLWKANAKYHIKADLLGSNARELLGTKTGNITRSLRKTVAKKGRPGGVFGRGQKTSIDGRTAKVFNMATTDREYFASTLEKVITKALAGAALMEGANADTESVFGDVGVIFAEHGVLSHAISHAFDAVVVETSMRGEGPGIYAAVDMRGTELVRVFGGRTATQPPVDPEYAEALAEIGQVPVVEDTEAFTGRDIRTLVSVMGPVEESADAIAVANPHAVLFVVEAADRDEAIDLVCSEMSGAGLDIVCDHGLIKVGTEALKKN